MGGKKISISVERTGCEVLEGCFVSGIFLIENVVYQSKADINLGGMAP